MSSMSIKQGAGPFSILAIGMGLGLLLASVAFLANRIHEAGKAARQAQTETARLRGEVDQLRADLTKLRQRVDDRDSPTRRPVARVDGNRFRRGPVALSLLAATVVAASSYLMYRKLRRPSRKSDSPESSGGSGDPPEGRIAQKSLQEEQSPLSSSPT